MPRLKYEAFREAHCPYAGKTGCRRRSRKIKTAWMQF
jgi:hypothetical protein